MPLLTIPIYLNFHFPYFNALFLIRKKFKTLDVMKEILLLSFFFLFLVALGFTLARQAFLPLEPLHQPLKLLFLCSFHRVHIDHFFFFGSAGDQTQGLLGSALPLCCISSLC
jgi:hypothetical protein